MEEVVSVGKLKIRYLKDGSAKKQMGAFELTVFHIGRNSREPPHSGHLLVIANPSRLIRFRDACSVAASYGFRQFGGT
jgi:hypothetical protein